jgi:carotenoid 1,2-hydratase
MPESVNPAGPPPFDLAVPRDGYRWWYLDAVSDDGRHALVIIAFVGSVFSPYYYRARQLDRGRPENHCAINVALYGPGGRWSMTERDASRLLRGADHFEVGPSRIEWRGDHLDFALDERCTPFGQALRGRVRAWPESDCRLDLSLDPGGRHRWTPWAPHSRVEVDLEAPRLRWNGRGYLDANAGSEPLEAAFSTWDWSRTERGDGLRLHYEVRYPEGEQRLFAYHVAPDGRHVEAEASAAQPQRRTGWGLSRGPRPGHEIRAVRGLEDTPFYSRSLFEAPVAGVHTVHEHLDMNRFKAPWVRLLLPFRMPRRKG